MAISSENVPGPSTPSNKDTSQSDGGYSGKDGGIGTTAGSDSWNPLSNGGNSGLPSSVSSPL